MLPPPWVGHGFPRGFRRCSKSSPRTTREFHFLPFSSWALWCACPLCRACVIHPASSEGDCRNLWSDFLVIFDTCVRWCILDPSTPRQISARAKLCCKRQREFRPVAGLMAITVTSRYTHVRFDLGMEAGVWIRRCVYSVVDLEVCPILAQGFGRALIGMIESCIAPCSVARRNVRCLRLSG